MKKKIRKLKPSEVKSSVQWLWNNRDRGGCCHYVLWVEPDFLNGNGEEENPHAGREWCAVIGWHDVGEKEDCPESYQDEHYVIQAGIRYQDADNGMQCDYDLDFTMPYPCNEYGDVYDLSFDVPRKPKGGWRAIAKRINEDAEEMYRFWKQHGGELE
jgi:hypothetical protein